MNSRILFLVISLFNVLPHTGEAAAAQTVVDTCRGFLTQQEAESLREAADELRASRPDLAKQIQAIAGMPEWNAEPEAKV